MWFVQGYCVSELRTSSISEGKQRNRKVSKVVFFSSYIHDKNVQLNQNVPIKEMLHSTEKQNHHYILTGLLERTATRFFNLLL